MSIAAQRDRGIDPERTPHRDKRSHTGNERKERAHGGKGRGVARRHAPELRLQEPRQRQRTGEAAEKAAAKVSAAKVDKAEDKLGEAADKRAEADRVAELAAAEKRERQEERAKD